MRCRVLALAIVLPLVATCAEFVPQAPRVQERAEIAWARVICSEEDRYIGWPSVCRLTNGEVLAVFSGDRDGHICPWGKVQLVRSSDEGETWSDPVTIANGPVDDRDAGIVQMPDGEVVVTYFTSVAYRKSLASDPPKPGTPRWAWKLHDDKLPPEVVASALGYFRISSRDNGRTWSAPQRMEKVSHAPHGPALMSDGSLLMLGRSFGTTDDDKGRAMDVKDVRCVISAWRSTDAARTWTCLQPDIIDEDGECFKPHMFHEPFAIDLGNGRIVGLVRYNGKDHLLRQTVSEDGGRTWSRMRKTGMAGLPPHLIRLPSGKIVAVYGRRRNMPTVGEYATISDDGGRTWDTAHEVQLIPSDHGDLGYPASCLLLDGSILTVCYQRLPNGRKARLLAVKWRVK